MRLVVWLLCIVWVASVEAIVLEKLIQSGQLESFVKNRRIGYYLGSFDPLHKGHESFVESFLRRGLGDLVIIYPSWGGDSYKVRADITVRLDMLFAAFEDHPAVIVTRLIPQELQRALTVPSSKRIGKNVVYKPMFEGVSFVGMLGSDVVRYLVPNKDTSVAYMTGTEISEEFKAHTLGSCMALPVDSFVVALREGDDISAVGNKLHDREIVATIVCEGQGLSSTGVKEALESRQSIDSFVSEPIEGIIEHHTLYTPSQE